MPVGAVYGTWGRLHHSGGVELPVPNAVPAILTRITEATTPMGLMVMGHLPDPDTENRAIVLIGADHGFWQVFITSPEYLDGTPHPVDRWSKRVLGGLARENGGACVFPSDGPPYAPFIAWAKKTGRFWQSPTGMLVHDRSTGADGFDPRGIDAGNRFAPTCGSPEPV